MLFIWKIFTYVLLLHAKILWLSFEFDEQGIILQNIEKKNWGWWKSAKENKCEWSKKMNIVRHLNY